jgi:hypothetical protein
LLKYVFDLHFEIKHLLENLVGLSLHLFDQLVFLVQKLLLSYLDPFVEAAWPVTNVQEVIVLMVLEHDLNGVNEEHLLLHQVDIFLDLAHFIVRSLQSLNVFKE